MDLPPGGCARSPALRSWKGQSAPQGRGTGRDRVGSDPGIHRLLPAWECLGSPLDAGISGLGEGRAAHGPPPPPRHPGRCLVSFEFLK